MAAAPVPPDSVWVARTPYAGLGWNKLYFKALCFPTGQGFFHRRVVPSLSFREGVLQWGLDCKL